MRPPRPSGGSRARAPSARRGAACAWLGTTANAWKTWPARHAPTRASRSVAASTARPIAASAPASVASLSPSPPARASRARSAAAGAALRASRMRMSSSRRELISSMRTTSGRARRSRHRTASGRRGELTHPASACLPEGMVGSPRLRAAARRRPLRASASRTSLHALRGPDSATDRTLLRRTGRVKVRLLPLGEASSCPRGHPSGGGPGRLTSPGVGGESRG